MDWDSITRTGARAPGVERWIRSPGGVHQHLVPDTEQGITDVSQEHEGRWQTSLLGRPRLTVGPWEPYRGKPAVRNFRGGDGNVGIIRSPVRAIALPHCRLLGSWVTPSADDC